MATTIKPTCRQGDWDRERLSNLPKVTQPISDRAGIQTQIVWLLASSHEGQKQGSRRTSDQETWSRQELSEEVLLELRPQVWVGMNSAKQVVVERTIILARGQNVQRPWGKREHGTVKNLKGKYGLNVEPKGKVGRHVTREVSRPDETGSYRWLRILFSS